MSKSLQTEIIQKSIQYIKENKLSLLLPKLIIREGIEFLYGTYFFEFEYDEEKEPNDRVLAACDPLGAVIVCLGKYQKPIKSEIGSLGSYATVCKFLSAEYQWVLGFEAGWKYGCVNWKYQPRKDFDLRMHWDPEAFDFGLELGQKEKKS